MDRFLKQDGDRDREFLTLTLGAEEYGIDILKVQEIRGYILALNAAVEQGRGFAVVAGEVHNLAQRSASAAKEIKTLISLSKAFSVFRVDGRVRDSEESAGSRMRIERRPFNVSSSQRSRSASLSNADGEWEAF